jgi:L-lysine 2,3-aminomutase
MSYSKETARNQRAMLNAIKSEKGCENCKGACLVSAIEFFGGELVEWLDFDHINPNTKLHNVSRMVGRYSYTTILAEVDKCRVLCKFCHTAHTKSQR